MPKETQQAQQEKRPVRKVSADQLVEQAVGIGIPETSARQMLTEEAGYQHLQVRIAITKRKKYLLERADKCGCTGLIESLLTMRQLDQAAAALKHIEELLPRAAACGIEATAREQLAQGRIDLTRAMVCLREGQLSQNAEGTTTQ